MERLAAAMRSTRPTLPLPQAEAAATFTTAAAFGRGCLTSAYVDALMAKTQPRLSHPRYKPKRLPEL